MIPSDLHNVAIPPDITLPGYDCDDIKQVDLPCQACYLHKHIIPVHSQTALPTEGTQCAICLDDLTVDAAGSDPETLLPN